MTLRAAVVVIAAVAAMLASGALATDHCNAYLTCQACVAAQWCGWCSAPVQYQNHSNPQNFQCAGFNQQNGSEPFVCNGIYSTNTCTRGYLCNLTSYECALAAPGSGQTKEACENNCSTVGKTFICDNATFTCQIAPAGQGTSIQVCEAACHASHAPSSSSPSSSSPSSSSPSSSSPSSQAPSSSPVPTAAPTYLCNASTLKCEQAPVGQGASLLVCQQNCKAKPGPPADLLGLWRGFPIDARTPLDEYDIDFHSNGSVAIYTRSWVSWCTANTVANTVVLSDCTAPGQPGLKCLWETSLTMPETFHAMFACNYAGGAAPSSFNSALAAANTSVLFLSRCVNDGFCKFHAGPNTTVHSSSNNNVKRAKLPKLGVTDPCEAYGANCTFCLSHALCGWCSANVQYSDGTVGTQCAGFSSNPHVKNSFTCTGSYSTEMCLPGWVCIPTNDTCVPTIPGSGVPQQDCATSCKAKPGPPSQLIGSWRGLILQNGYPYGALAVTINASGVVANFQGELLFDGTMKHLGGDVFITYTSGPQKGATIAGMYTNNENEVVEYIEMAFGGSNVDPPANYKVAMNTPPDFEVVLAKCMSSNCKF